MRLTQRNPDLPQVGRRGLLLLVAGAMAATVVGPARADQASALRILKGMSDFMARQQTLSARFDVDVEIVTPNLQKIQFTASGDVTLDRKAGIRARRAGGYADMELVFDGKTMTVHNVGEMTYAQVPAAGSLDELVERLRSQYLIEIPGADLLLSDGYGQLLNDATEAAYIGQGVVDGTVCEHLAFRSPDVDWQLWIATGDRPIPCKYVITSKTVAQAPQYTLRIKEMATGAPVAASVFAFAPPAGARQVAIADIGNLDEVPPGTPAKGLQP